MQPKPLREVDPRGRAGAVEVQSKDPRALSGVRRGSLLRSYPSRSALWAELCLGLSTWLPMPSGRQLLLSRWRHVCGTPSRLVVDAYDLSTGRGRRQGPNLTVFTQGAVAVAGALESVGRVVYFSGTLSGRVLITH
jgi:hypothetical protein